MTADVDPSAFHPATTGPTALFLDTSGLVAYFHPRADEHEATAAFVERVRDGELPYRPLYTSTYVLDELVTVLESRGDHHLASHALETLPASDATRVVYESPERFEAAVEAYHRYDDLDASFTDHLIAAQMDARGVEHVLTYDGDFAALGLTPVPRSGE